MADGLVIALAFPEVRNEWHTPGRIAIGKALKGECVEGEEADPKSLKEAGQLDNLAGIAVRRFQFHAMAPRAGCERHVRRWNGHPLGAGCLPE